MQIHTFSLKEAEERAKLRPPEYMSELKAIALRWGTDSFDIDISSKEYRDLIIKYRNMKYKVTDLSPKQIIQGASNLIKSKAGQMGLINNMAPEDVIKERLTACSTCEYGLNKDKAGLPTKCGICGCGLQNKVKLAAMSCPLGSSSYPAFIDKTPRWTAVTINQTT